MMKETLKNSTRIQSMGGKARAISQKEEAKKRIDTYNENPNLCLNCGKPILAPYGKKLNETKRKKFCCQSCAAQYSNKHRKSIAGWIGDARIDSMDDDYLVDEFSKSNSISEFANRIGYSKSALRNEHVIKRLNDLGLFLEDLNVRNKFNNLTKKEAFDLCKNWQSARSIIAKSARKNYQTSDKPKCCIICGYGNYEVAHIKAVNEFEDDALIKDINFIENLIALCPNHHYEYDNGIIKKEDLINILSNSINEPIDNKAG